MSRVFTVLVSLVVGGTTALTQPTDPVLRVTPASKKGEPIPITDVAFSPDGRYFLAGSSETGIGIWRTSDGKLLRTVDAVDCGGAFGLRFTPDGKHFLAGNEWGKVTRWNVATGRIHREIQAHASYVTGFDLDPGGSLLVTVGWDNVGMHNEVRLWDLRSGARTLTIALGTEERLREDAIYSVAISPDGQQLASVHLEDRIDYLSMIHIWDTKSGRHTRKVGPIEGYPVGSGPWLRFAPDGSLFCRDHEGISRWEAQTGKLLSSIKPNRNRLKRDAPFALSGDGQVLALPLRNDIHIFETATGTLVHTIPLAAKAVAFAPDGHNLLAGGKDGSITLWRLNPHRNRARLSPRDLGRLWDLLGDDDGQVAYHVQWRLIDAGDAALPALAERLPSATDRQRRRSVQVLERIGTPAAGKLLGRMADDSTVKREATAAIARTRTRRALPAVAILTPEQVAELRQHLPGTRAPRTLGQAAKASPLVFSPDGRWLAYASQESIRIIDAAGKGHKTYPSNGAGITAFAFSPDCRRLAFADSNGAVSRWAFLESETAEIVERQPKEIVQCLAFAPDGKLLAAGMKSGFVSVRPTAGDAAPHRFKANVDAVTALVFTPDGKSLLVAGMEKKVLDFDGALKFEQSAPIRQWNVESGKLVRKLDMLGTHLAFSADRRTLIVSGNVRGFVDNPYIRGFAMGGYGGYYTIDGVTFADALVVHHWDWQQDRLVRQFKSKGCQNAISADGRWILTGGYEDRHIDPLVEWATNTTGGGGPYGGHDPRLHLWEAATGKEVLRAPSKYPAAVAIAPDGRMLAWIDGLGNVRLWDVSPAKPAAKAPPLESLWSDLAAADAAKAYEAQWIMNGHRRETVAWLKAHLKPAPKDQDDRIHSLVSQLRSDNFKVRDAALRELQKRGGSAEAALEIALPKEASLESRRRMQSLLDGLRANGLSNDELRQVRSVHALQWFGDGDARALLQTLAQGSPLSPQTRAARAALE